MTCTPSLAACLVLALLAAVLSRPPASVGLEGPSARQALPFLLGGGFSGFTGVWFGDLRGGIDGNHRYRRYYLHFREEGQHGINRPVEIPGFAAKVTSCVSRARRFHQVLLLQCLNGISSTGFAECLGPPPGALHPSRTHWISSDSPCPAGHRLGCPSGG